MGIFEGHSSAYNSWVKKKAGTLIYPSSLFPCLPLYLAPGEYACAKLRRGHEERHKGGNEQYVS